jgi:hypothetical protein
MKGRSGFEIKVTIRVKRRAVANKGAFPHQVGVDPRFRLSAVKRYHAGYGHTFLRGLFEDFLHACIGLERLTFDDTDRRQPT